MCAYFAVIESLAAQYALQRLEQSIGHPEGASQATPEIFFFFLIKQVMLN